MYVGRPFVTNSIAFGSNIVDIGNVANNSYRTLLVSDPEAQNGGAFNGAVFLYNIGRGLKDSCVAWVAGSGFEAYMGSQAIPVGDVDHDGRDDFMVARDAEIILGPAHIGAVTLFQGSDSYGPPVAVHEPALIPAAMTLSQNFPNPTSSLTDVTFTIRAPGLAGVGVSLKIFDLLGREVMTAYRGVADGYGYTIRINTAYLPAGEYVYRLQCAGTLLSKRMIVLH